MKLISKNTTWTGSVTLTDDVQIAAGVTLTIAAGTRVEGKGHSIETFGTLKAKGTASSNIYIHNTVMGLSKNYNMLGRIDISDAHVDGGSINSPGVGYYGSTNLQNSLITNSGLLYATYPQGGNTTISGNVFLNSEGIKTSSMRSEGYGTVDIGNNIFDRYPSVTYNGSPQQGSYAISVFAGYDGNVPISHDNAFLSLGKISLAVEYTSGDLVSRNDYFGTTNRSIINKMVHDHNDDYGIEHTIDVSSFASAPSKGLMTSLASFTSIELPREIVKDAVLLGSDDNNLTGNTLANKLTGNAGGNVLDGKAGADTMTGGLGDDTYVVDSSADKVVELSAAGHDTVVASASYTLSANVEDLLLVGSASISGKGNASANVLTGNAGGNSLDGSAGNDVLQGGLGNDKLTGGSGSDTFVFDTALGTKNVDHITDFSVVNDTIRLNGNVFFEVDFGELAASAFKDIAKAGTKLDADDRILYDHDSGRLYYDKDGSGAAAKVQFAILDTHPTITAHDFFIV